MASTGRVHRLAVSTTVNTSDDGPPASEGGHQAAPAGSRCLLISGSVRRRSTNTAVLSAIANLELPGLHSVLYTGVAQLPAFNPDDDNANALPPSVVALRTEIHRADSLLFSVPEYAGALPGALKNLLDWTIGDADPRSIHGKPVGWINASPRGAAGAHQELAVVLGYAGALITEEACVRLPVTEADLDDAGGLGRADMTADLVSVIRALASAAAPHGTNT